MEIQGKINAIRKAENDDGRVACYVDVMVETKKGKFKGHKTTTINAYDQFAILVEALDVGREILVTYKSIKGKGKSYKKMVGLMA